MSHRMFMWSERKALQSSGLILCDSIEAARLVEQTLFASNTSWKRIAMLMRAWDEYFKN